MTSRPSINEKLISKRDSERELFTTIFSTTCTQCAPEATEFGEITQIRALQRSRSFKVTDFGTIRKLIYDFLLMINTNLPPILHRFRDIAFDWSKIDIFGCPSCVYSPPPTEGFPGTISVKFSMNVNGWQRYQRRKNLPKVSTG